MYKVLICGDRNWGNEEVFPKTWKQDLLDIGEMIKKLQKEHGSELVIIHGAARGADSAAEWWANQLGVATESYPAYWNCDIYEFDTGQPCKFDGEHSVVHGRPAGAIRNRRMYQEGKPSLIIAYHRNIDESKGTKDMIGIAKRGGTEIWMRP